MTILSVALGALLTVLLAGSAPSPEEPRNDKRPKKTAPRRHDARNPIYNTIPEEYKRTDVASLIRIDTPAQLAEKRQALIRFVFGADQIPSLVVPEEVSKGIADPAWALLPPVRRIDSLKHTMEHGIDSRMYYFHAKKPSGRLAIYHQGHGGDFRLGKEMVRGLLGVGCDVIALAMPLMGKNSAPEIELDHLGLVRLATHDWMQFLEQPFKFFMEPIAAAVNYGLTQRDKEYEEIIMVGFSGGAWATTLYAAMDPRVLRSYPIAGTAPYYLRADIEGVYKGQMGDFEQRHTGLLLTANYLEMYVMGSSGEGRMQMQVINQFDKSVASHGIKHQTYQSIVQERVRKLGPGEFKVFLDDSSGLKHVLRNGTILHIVDDLLPAE